MVLISPNEEHHRDHLGKDVIKLGPQSKYGREQSTLSPSDCVYDNHARVIVDGHSHSWEGHQ